MNFRLAGIVFNTFPSFSRCIKFYSHPFDRLNYELFRKLDSNDRLKRPKVLFSFSNLPTNQIRCHLSSVENYCVDGRRKGKTTILSLDYRICAINGIEQTEIDKLNNRLAPHKAHQFKCFSHRIATAVIVISIH